jgi:hypothetical protein
MPVARRRYPGRNQRYQRQARSIPINVLVTGVSGFVGSHLAHTLIERGHTVVGLARRGAPGLPEHPRFRFVAADTTRSGSWQHHVAGVDTIVNLAGRSIFGRWTAAVKAEIRESRIRTTRNVIEAVPAGCPVRLISASGAGYFGSRGEDVLAEDEPVGTDFLATLSAEWEAEALRGGAKGLRVAAVRLGVVLAGDGGALAQMIPAFRRFVGGPVGDGRQWFPWIHMDDLVSALVFLADRPELGGAFNLCAPEPVRNRELAAALGRALNRPAVVPAPAFLLRAMLGEFADVLLASQRMVPRRLLQLGFEFDYPDIRAALRAIFGAGAGPERG